MDPSIPPTVAEELVPHSENRLARVAKLTAQQRDIEIALARVASKVERMAALLETVCRDLDAVECAQSRLAKAQAEAEAALSGHMSLHNAELERV